MGAPSCKAASEEKLDNQILAAAAELEVRPCNSCLSLAALACASLPHSSTLQDRLKDRRESPREKPMKRLTISRILTAGTAAAILVAAQAIAVAQERGSVQGVISDAYGKPVAGAFVKLKNDERRLTFMVVTREQGQFEAKDLPPGQYRVQGVAGANQSDWFDKVQVTTGGSAKVGLALTHQRGPMLQPAWPQRIPELQVDQVALDLPAGDG